MASNDAIDFDLIEGQKENIQSLPGGRSAKKLAQIYSPTPLGKLSTPTPSDTRSVNDCIRAEYEAEIQNLAESDDPLDVFDRYVRWTLDAYPSAQATPQSQLHTLLERATKAFISSSQYKNDPRYLKMWMHYIQFFSDSPRETYLFLSRHAIGERLALFYEEYAAWLESAGRWSQAEEVYKLGIEREARPVQRLLRKFKEFEERWAQQPEGADEPSSPALPTVRPALAMKTDPFGAAASGPSDPQAQRQPASRSARPAKGRLAIFSDDADAKAKEGAKPAKGKLAIFSDADAKPSALSTKETGSKGWDTIGSMAERKKENTVEAKPWTGETLKAGGKKPAAAGKMAVFRDSSLAQIQNIVVVPSKNQVTVHPQTGKRERIFANLAVLYPTPEEFGTELSFEEVMAANRGWLDYNWDDVAEDENTAPRQMPTQTIEEVSKAISEKLVIHHDQVHLDENGQMVEPPRQSKAGRKKKMMEVNETQIIKAKLDSPSGPKIRKKNTSEPTMTLHTRAATDDIYDIFNAPLKQPAMGEDDDSDNYDSDDYTTDAESTTRQLDNVDNDDPGEEEEEEEEENDAGEDEEDDLRSVSEWSDFNAHKHIPIAEGQEQGQDELNATQVTELVDRTIQRDQEEDYDQEDEENMSAMGVSSPRTHTSFVPILPEDYDPPPTRPFRDAAEMANNRLPFMTPITERTEVSLDVDAQYRRDQFKTPCKQDGMAIFRDGSDQDEEQSDLEAMSSPLREILSNERTVAKTPLQPSHALALSKGSAKKPLRAKGPIIKEAQCNPVDEEVRKQILAQTQPPLDSFRGFYHHREEKYERGSDIRKFAKAFRRTSRGSSAGSPAAPVVLEFADNSASYVLKRELGAGAYAPVYLVENQDPNEEVETDENAVVAMGKGSFAVNLRSELEALKMETPPSVWEFYMMRVAHNRLGPQHRASASLSYAHEMHLYQDEGFLFLPYHPHGTILDVVNLFRAEASGVMDEQLAMFFTIELMRTVEALHAKGVLHGDIKPDNCLLRLDNTMVGSPEQRIAQALDSQWKSDGTGGWGSRGITLIDFGRAIDMRAFTPDVQFIAEWKTTAQDCAEMREGRPWTWQVDYHGLAGTIHCLLFGKYIETVRCDEGGLTRGGRRYRIRESLKRYWQTDLWSECFEVLLNPGSFVEVEEGSQMPVLKSMRGLREKMEAWLQDNSEKGVGLKSLMGRLEAFAKTRK